ncbi:GGDEF domain-containing protein [Tepidibacter hydrothermalis]|uniref:GGDEF domain-containing protein n=1 Tax=Tepidibacter hydrothermalis TaxID=3036126 RepID=A0ABY8EJP9_9FIRM|nr:GGDEF domain-containing protein [Tepidibacter hydrothermalis]WFD12400.1 GGDEF domain-containing protein [Tepidibacter hydrothermalis]
MTFKEDQHLRIKIFNEIYMGLKIMSLFFVLMLILFVPLDEHFKSKLISFSFFYFSYISLTFLLFFKGIEKFNTVISIFDAIFTAFFIHISNDNFHSFLAISYIYIMFQILVDKKGYVFFYPFLFTILDFILIYFYSESSITIDSFFHIFFMYIFAYIFSSIVKQQLELEEKIHFLFTKVEDKNKELRNMVDMDYLTNLLNHKSFYSSFDELLDHYKNSKREFSLALMDIDNFKKVNDTYGHLAGDIILKESATIISNISGNNHMAFRYGGEEFALLLKDTGVSSSYMICEEIRNTIENHVFVVNGDCIRITLSIGLMSSCNGFDISNPREFISNTDILLYKAKNSGKNVVMLKELDRFICN